MDGHSAAFPAILEIPSKDHPYGNDICLQPYNALHTTDSFCIFIQIPRKIVSLSVSEDCLASKQITLLHRSFQCYSIYKRKRERMLPLFCIAIRIVYVFRDGKLWDLYQGGGGILLLYARNIWFHTSFFFGLWCAMMDGLRCDCMVLQWKSDCSCWDVIT